MKLFSVNNDGYISFKVRLNVYSDLHIGDISFLYMGLSILQGYYHSKQT